MEQRKMTKWQKKEMQTRNTKRFLKKCSIANEYQRLGFKNAIINSVGKCGGCYEPDTGEMESACKNCLYNEYYIKEAV